MELRGVDTRVLVVDWKFTELDRDGDRVLEEKELERLGRLVKKLVKPTLCATSFHSRCDLDFDSSLTLHEWKTCFTDDQTSLSAVDGSRYTGFRINTSFYVPPCISVCLSVGVSVCLLGV